MGIILVCLTENLLATANLKRFIFFHRMCQLTPWLYNTGSVFSGLARKIILSLPCPTLNSTELSRTRGGNILTAPSIFSRSYLSDPFDFSCSRDTLHWLYCWTAPYMGDKQCFFTVVLHWRQYSAHITWSVITISNKELGFQEAIFSSVIICTIRSLPRYCSCCCRNAMWQHWRTEWGGLAEQGESRS